MTLDDLTSELAQRLGDATNLIWTIPELEQYATDALMSLYPAFYQLNTDTTTAGAGPIQTLPSGAINLHYVGIQSSTATRARVIRGWQEGQAEAMIPKLGITGQTLIWAWTSPHPFISMGADLTTPIAANEVILLRAHITALERILTDRVTAEKYFAVQVREGVTENEIISTLDALHASVDARLKNVVPLPERVG